MTVSDEELQEATRGEIAKTLVPSCSRRFNNSDRKVYSTCERSRSLALAREIMRMRQTRPGRGLEAGAARYLATNTRRQGKQDTLK